MRFLRLSAAVFYPLTLSWARAYIEVVFYADDAEPLEELTYADKRLFSAYSPDFDYGRYDVDNGWTFVKVLGNFGEAPYPEGYGPEDVAFYRYSIILEGEGVYYIRYCLLEYELDPALPGQRLGFLENDRFNETDGEGKPLHWEITEYGSADFSFSEWDASSYEGVLLFKSALGVAPGGGLVKLSQMEYVDGWYEIDGDFKFTIRAAIRYKPE